MNRENDGHPISTGRARIGSVACAVPTCHVGQDFAADFMRRHYGEGLSPRNRRLLRATFAHPGIRKRHLALDDPEHLLEESRDQRIARFTEQSVELAARAVTAALEKAGVTAGEVVGLVVNTCTGYICPGVSSYLSERLGLAPTTWVHDLVGSGCGGAIPNLQVAESLLRTRQEGVVVSVSVEICTATFQMGDDLSLILSNALFGDGAAAAVLWNRPEGLELTASAARHAPRHREAIRFVHRDGELHNQLSLDLPDLVRNAAAEVVADVLSPKALTPGDIRHWALHTGGEKIINAVRDEIGIPEERLRATRHVLAEYGNMSSPTVWFVLEEILRCGMDEGDWCLMVAYGAGLSAHSFLLRKR